MESRRGGTRPTGKAVESVLTAVDEAMLARLVPEPVRIRALDLFLLGRVESRLVSGTRLLGEVRGTRGVYRTVVHVLRGPGGPDAAGQCECPRRARGGLCKHAVALLYAWIHEPATFASLDERLDRLAERPRAQLLEVIRRLVEEEPALLAELDATISADSGPAGTGTAPAPATAVDAGRSPVAPRRAEAAGDGPAGTGDGLRTTGGPAATDRPGRPHPVPAPGGDAAADGDEPAAPAWRGARLAAWVLRLERNPDPGPEELDRWLAELGGEAAGPPPASGAPGAADDTGTRARIDGRHLSSAGPDPEPRAPGGTATAGHALARRRDRPDAGTPAGRENLYAGALALLVQGVVWRQAGMVLAARAREEDDAARWLMGRWEAAARLLVHLAGALGPSRAAERAVPAVPAGSETVGPPPGPLTPAEPRGRRNLAASVALTAAALGPEALLAASRFFQEAGWPATALGLARRALRQAGSPDQVAAARAVVARIWLDRGLPDRALPYLAANFAARPDAERLAALEEVARAAGQWDQVAPQVRRHLEAHGEPALLAAFLLNQGAWDELLARLEDPAWRAALPARLLVAAADGLRRRDPWRAAALYREAAERPGADDDAGDPWHLAARWEALAHRLERMGGGAEGPSGSVPGDLRPEPARRPGPGPSVDPGGAAGHPPPAAGAAGDGHGPGDGS